MTRQVERTDLDGLLARLGAGVIAEPLLVEFEPLSPDPADTFDTIRRRDHGDKDEQYLSSSELDAADLIRDGDRVFAALDALSVLEVQRGTWLSWPGMVSDFHRDWNLWSAANFMFCGEKVWHLVEARAVRPRHANLVLGDRANAELLRRAERGDGYRIVQQANECLFVPGGFYHRVETLEFSVNFAMWSTPAARLTERRHPTDGWWHDHLRRQPWLKPECSAAVEASYQARPWFERAVARRAYDRYWRWCGRRDTAALERYHEAARADAATMQALLACDDVEAARVAAADRA